MNNSIAIRNIVFMICQIKIGALLLCGVISGIVAQPVAIGQWRDHLPLLNSIAITESSDKIYCAAKQGAFSYNKSDYTIERLSTATGLAETGLSYIHYHSQSNTVLIGYESGNLDVIKDEDVINFSDIKRSQVIGNRTINKIVSLGKFAYLACGFGIVVLDMEKLEVRDTYFIGENSVNIKVNDIAFFQDSIYAATEVGVYTASLVSTNLAHFNAWKKSGRFPKGVNKFNEVEVFNNSVYVNFSSTKKDSDTLYYKKNDQWVRLDSVKSRTIIKIEATSSRILLTFKENSSRVYDLMWNDLGSIAIYPEAYWPEAKHAIIGSDGIVWTSDSQSGLYKSVHWWGSEVISPNSPREIKAYSMANYKGKLVIPTGTRAYSNGSNFWVWDGYMVFEDNMWQTVNKLNTSGLDNIPDMLYAAIDPLNINHIFISSLGGGLVELLNNKVVNVFNNTNSPIEDNSGNVNHFGVTGLAFDDNNNLWIANTSVEKALKVLKKDGTWISFDIPELSGQSFIERIIITKSGMKWITVPYQGVVVFDDNNTPDNQTDDKSRILKKGEGNGNLPALGRLPIVEDLDGKIWLGSEEGLVVFNSPDNMFAESGFDAQRILVQKDNYYEYLFEKEVVTALAVDGANRKWVGTDGGGVFMISADGTEELLHFTEKNSPLVSDRIACLSINQLTGEVFIGTEQGIMSYRGTAIEASESYNEVYTFPNPVESGYDGPIAIKGLVGNSNIKIADVSGNIVYETTSEGGQAIWHGENFDGKRVQSGVYFIFGVSPEGDQKMVSKIMFFN